MRYVWPPWSEHRGRAGSAERVAALLAVGYGVTLLGPWATYAATPSYTVLAQVVPEANLGTLFLLLGAGGAGAILAGSVPLRRMYLLGQSALWGFLAAALCLANPAAGSWLPYGAWALVLGLKWWYLYEGRPVDADNRRDLWPGLTHRDRHPDRAAGGQPAGAPAARHGPDADAGTPPAPD